MQKFGKINKKRELTSLNPFLDSNQILRVGGRLQVARVDEDMKHPLILPHNSPLTLLVIDEAHNKTRASINAELFEEQILDHWCKELSLYTNA